MAEPQKGGDELPAATATISPSYTAILQEHDVVEKQRQTRLKLIEEIEKLESAAARKKKAAVVAHIAKEGGSASIALPELLKRGAVYKKSAARLGCAALTSSGQVRNYFILLWGILNHFQVLFERRKSFLRPRFYIGIFAILRLFLEGSDILLVIFDHDGEIFLIEVGAVDCIDLRLVFREGDALFLS